MQNKYFKYFLSLVLVFALCLSVASPAFAAGTTVFTGIDTLMIYNPLVEESSTMSTGSMLGQISSVSDNFLYTEDDAESFYFADQGAFLDELAGIEPDETLADSEYTAQQESYSVGSTRSFFYQPGSSYTGASATFTCLYSGTHCQVWGYGFSNSTISDALGEAFDNWIYENNTEAFGTARYLKDGGKLNILIYTMYSSGLCGFFRPIELMTASEMGSYYAANYNSGEAIIHINSSVCTSSYYESMGLITIAHEYQHLICFSSSLLGLGGSSYMMGTWLNESMAMQAEEINYPGEVVAAEYISYSYNNSSDVAGGQSLYDFSTNNDIGVYGQAFMFSEYIKQQADSNVFSEIHNYWRTASPSYLTDEDVLKSVIPESVRSEILNSVTYSSSVDSSLTDSQEFLSKLNLSFQLASALQKGSGIYSIGSACYEAAPKMYTGTKCSIEGGGRIFVRTNDGESYTVPSGADSRLVYVGFKDGKIVIAPTTAENYTYSGKYTIKATSSDSSLGTVSVSGNIITAVPAEGCGYGVPAYTVTSGTATVIQSGNTFTVIPSSNCTVRINFEEKSDTIDVWDGSIASSIPISRGVYTISTGEQLAKLAKDVNSGNDYRDCTVRLANDIDLNHIQWTPIGNSDERFRGIFDGNGYTIYNMDIGSSASPYNAEDCGLFGYIISDETIIRNLTLENISVHGTESVGGIAGTLSGYVENCHVSGNISGERYIGMICGWGSRCTIENSSSTGSISCSQTSAGGIIGYSSGATVSQCWSSASISSSGSYSLSYFGGIAGQAGTSSSVSNCYSLSELTGTRYLGGISGYGSNTTFTNCYWAGTISGTEYRGGILGNVSSGYPVTISGCYFSKTGCRYAVADSSSYSGATGVYTYELKEQSLYSGWDFDSVWGISEGANDDYPYLRWQKFQVTEVTITGSQHYLFPGETLQLSLNILPDIADDTSYSVYSSNPTVLTVTDTGLCTAVKTGEAYVTLTSLASGLTATYDITVMEPEYISAGFDGGDGSYENPYIIATPGNLLHLAQINNYGYSFDGCYFLQVADIDMNCSADNPWVPIGEDTATAFHGQYDGGSHTISGLYMNDSGCYYQGLFGVLDGATVLCLNIDDSSFIDGTAVGAFAGCALSSNILDCNTLSGTLISTSEGFQVGGVVGIVSDYDGYPSQVGFCSNAAQIVSTGSVCMAGGIGGVIYGSDSVVAACRNTGTVSATGSLSYTGGIFGTSSETNIASCYNSASIKGYGSTGGIAGYLDGDGTSQIFNCYNSGYISNSSYPSGGIAGMTIDGSAIYYCYNCANVSASYSSYARGIAGSNGGTVSYCYYLSSTTYDSYATSRSSSQLRSSSSLPYLDFSDTWTFVYGENNDYPVLTVFYPYTVIASDAESDFPIFDKAYFSHWHRDIVVHFDTDLNVLTGLQGVDSEYFEVVESTEDSATYALVISSKYLDTLATGYHTLTAICGAHCLVDFEIEVIDTTPDYFLFAAESINEGTESTEVVFAVSAPEERNVILVLAAYENGRMIDYSLTSQSLSYGYNSISVNLDGLISDTAEYTAFLLDADTHTVLCASQPLVPASLTDAKLLSPAQSRLATISAALSALVESSID